MTSDPHFKVTIIFNVQYPRQCLWCCHHGRAILWEFTRFIRPTEDRRLSRPSWLVTYRDGLPVHRRSPILVLTGSDVAQLRWSRPTRYHWAKPSTKHDRRSRKVAVRSRRGFTTADKKRVFVRQSLWLYCINHCFILLCFIILLLYLVFTSL